VRWAASSQRFTRACKRRFKVHGISRRIVDANLERHCRARRQWVIDDGVHELEDFVRLRIAQRHTHRRDRFAVATDVADFAAHHEHRRIAFERALDAEIVELKAVDVDVETERRERARRTGPQLSDVLTEDHHAGRGCR